MPVLLNERTAEDWMNPRQGDLLRLKSLLDPAPDDKLVLSPASSLVNRVNNDGPELLVPRSNDPAATELFLESSIHAQRLLVGSNCKVFLSGRMIVWEFEYFLPAAIDDPARKRFFRTAQSIKLSFDPSRQLILSVA
jgi:hypothetical protein